MSARKRVPGQLKSDRGECPKCHLLFRIEIDPITGDPLQVQYCRNCDVDVVLPIEMIQKHALKMQHGKNIARMIDLLEEHGRLLTG